MSAYLTPGTYWWTIRESNHSRTVVKVELLGRVPMEHDYYRVRQQDGRIGIASGSMLRAE
jgi:hypothetical protein